MLGGPTGTGKTYSLRTLCDAGITPFVLFTEPGMRTLSDLDCSQLHYRYVPPARPAWKDMIKSAEMINRMDLKSLANLTDINKRKYGQFIEVLNTLASFTCDRCGQNFGAVDEWQTDRAICVDSMSGLNIMAMDLVVGSKPVKSMSDWGIAMDNLERLINNLAANMQCTFVLITHIERETDEVLGGIKLMTSTLGRKLAPRLPRFFDDVVLCEKKGAAFTWSTANSTADLKNRNLPLADKIKPSFVPLIESWKKVGGIIEPTQAD